MSDIRPKNRTEKLVRQYVISMLIVTLISDHVGFMNYVIMAFIVLLMDAIMPGYVKTKNEDSK